MDPEFQSTAPVWGPTNQKGKQVFGRIISIHGPRVGADHIGNATLIRRIDFNPRPPCGGRLGLRGIGNLINLFQSTAPVWGPTLLVAPDIRAGGISIHGPRVGADPKSQAVRQTLRHFNPRPPCGGRLMIYTRLSSPSSFQSTAPVWGPTPPQSFLPVPRRRISIHGPRVGADDISMIVDTVNREISIHGPRVGADPPDWLLGSGDADFNPRPPCGGRRLEGYLAIPDRPDFNPRPPCGGRLNSSWLCWARELFQSTAPVWGPTRSSVDSN